MCKDGCSTVYMGRGGVGVEGVGGWGAEHYEAIYPECHLCNFFYRRLPPRAITLTMQVAQKIFRRPHYILVQEMVKDWWPC